MFSNGQIIFAILFFITFVIVLAGAYKKDKKKNSKYFKGSVWVLIAFISFILLIATIKFVFG